VLLGCAAVTVVARRRQERVALGDAILVGLVKCLHLRQRCAAECLLSESETLGENGAGREGIDRHLNCLEQVGQSLDAKRFRRFSRSSGTGCTTGHTSTRIARPIAASRNSYRVDNVQDSGRCDRDWHLTKRIIICAIEHSKSPWGSMGVSHCVGMGDKCVNLYLTLARTEHAIVHNHKK
jgi:hypothetical protein